ncbi:addiction module protein [Rubrivirga sp. S365]|uniref:Addiction module protein n=1 Tax=Rubrivirga litoralis TaxID=3075598 RepID=A0ABU3BQV7_9BACT|nr:MULTISPECIES: addiction module protein [unclassified Rubrivirga]MDT0631668.1 addiction module protein [Rubrivirga sp. F394]MDT7855589.1 addiction module protein [Rubrivirga sp. S365]
MSLQEIESQALLLPPGERALLAQHLISSLDEEDEIERVWADEAARRWDALVSGEVKGIPVADALADARHAVS